MSTTNRYIWVSEPLPARVLCRLSCVETACNFFSFCPDLSSGNLLGMSFINITRWRNPAFASFCVVASAKSAMVNGTLVGNLLLILHLMSSTKELWFLHHIAYYIVDCANLVLLTVHTTWAVPYLQMSLTPHRHFGSWFGDAGCRSLWR